MFEDTSPEAFEAYMARLRQETLQERAQAFDALVRDGFRMATIGLRLRYPDETEEKLTLRRIIEFYGRDFAERNCGPLPPDIQ